MSATIAQPRVLSSRLFPPYRLIEFQTRFGEVEWFVEDTTKEDPETGLPCVIRQATTRAKAIEGLV